MKRRIMFSVLVACLLLVVSSADSMAFGEHGGVRGDMVLKAIGELNLSAQQWSTIGPLLTNYENAAKEIRAAQKTFWMDLKNGNTASVAADLKAVESARTAARDQKKALWTSLDGLAKNDPTLATALTDLKAKRLAAMKARLNSLCQRIQDLGGTCSQ